MAAPGSNPNPAISLAKLLGALIVAGVLGAGVLLPFVGGAGLVAKHYADKFENTTCNLQETPPPEKTQIYASDGKTLIATIFKQDRQPIPLKDVPKPLVDALVATEDRRFYSHHGVDMRGLIRSAISTSSGDTQGGSTLTMQYVKQIRYYQAGDNPKKQADAIAQNLNRKIEDAKCALYLEGTKHESKATILDNYLNIAFFGENSYGIETAARTYFDKSASQLTLPESAMLVGLLRAPTQYDPFINPEAARQRRDQVLDNMVSYGKLTAGQAARLKSTPVSLATTAPPQVREGCANAASSVQNVGFFCDYAVNWLLDHKAVTESQMQTGGLKIVTTLDAKLQNSMQQRLHSMLSTKAPMAAIMPVVDPHTGDVLAMSTTKRYDTSGRGGTTTLPIFTSYTAQAASTYKLFPLLVALSTGVDKGWQMQTPTGPYQWKNCPPDNGTVLNGDANEFYNPGGNLTMRDATIKSSNTFFVGMADQLFSCQLQPIIQMAQKLGIQSFGRPSSEPHTTVGQSILQFQRATRLTLGDIETSPLELTSAYAAVANDGRYNAPSPIKSVTTSKGEPIRVPRTPSRQVISPQVAREAVQIMEGDTQAPGTSATSFATWYQSHPDLLISGKTGTAPGVSPRTHQADKNGALWFAGMTPNYVATTALINLDRPSNPASGLPGVTDAADNAYGGEAAKFWIAALAPTLQHKAWTWPSADAVNGDPVPSVVGYSPADARRLLKRDGYKMQLLGAADGLSCASTQPIGQIAYSGPSIAPRGATITVCPSSGIRQDLYVYVPPPPPPTHASGPTGNPGGGSHSGGGQQGGGGQRGGGSSSAPAPPVPPPSSNPVPPGHSHGPGGGNGNNARTGAATGAGTTAGTGAGTGSGTGG
ncbi:MAG TPA: transglycosylase domain-containing protein [Jatrophihabitans sp.]